MKEALGVEVPFSGSAHALAEGLNARDEEPQAHVSLLMLDTHCAGPGQSLKFRKPL